MNGLRISAAGMVTAVGLDAPSSCAALRARIDGFAETRFAGPGGEWLRGAAVPLPRQWIGEKRWAHLAAGALLEVLKQSNNRRNVEVILCLPEEDRPGRPILDADSFLHRVQKILGLDYSLRSKVVTHGRPSGIVALSTARKALARDPNHEIAILGVDSYLTGRTIQHYLSQQRLLTADNPEGFLPGEAAAAVLCRGAGPGMNVGGIGLSREEAHFLNGQDENGFNLPLRGEGMAAAYKAALSEAGLGLHEIGVKIGDLIGETFWFKQSELASLRTQRERSEVHPIWPIAAALGNIGAAVVPVMLGWALAAVRKDYAHQKPLLIESSADDGACGVAIVGGLSA
ncbi:3-oxoacyl-ACP synthase [uncultured Tateyamaria sp.]|uniref:3-oxoacyl-ACP synthase n=1 Tax=uncultured Tateyamaria sp. TaxID=455651 RepID=UPI002607C6FD|nr:3-oxoacyl-ACP synthase [uncultured Tateyamaria sp.]